MEGPQGEEQEGGEVPEEQGVLGQNFDAIFQCDGGDAASETSSYSRCSYSECDEESSTSDNNRSLRSDSTDSEEEDIIEDELSEEATEVHQDRGCRIDQ